MLGLDVAETVGPEAEANLENGRVELGVWGKGSQLLL